jgi:hypothetical protein
MRKLYFGGKFMDFIRTYFNTKIGAFCTLLGIIKDAWDAQIWLAVILVALWTLFCTVGGLLILPFDVIFCAIVWYANKDIREVMEDMEEEFGLVEE